MKIVLFGLSISSSWGNGHATLWRGLCRGLVKLGHRPVFFERDVPYYAAHRDYLELPGGLLHLYPDWESALSRARAEVAGADVAMITSYCPDGLAASELVLSSNVPVRAFYDLDTPVTLDRLRSGQTVDYLPARGLRDFDIVLSYTGGAALSELREKLGARRVEPLYGSVDPLVHKPIEPIAGERSYDLSYLGTYAEDRQRGVNDLFIEPARRMPGRRFLLGGASYDANFPWTNNIFFRHHIAPAGHPAFYCSSHLTLNVTRRAMREMGYCPSGRLFESAACGVPVITDEWEGLDRFFTPGSEILIAHGPQDLIDALEMPHEQLKKLGAAARERTLAEHTSDKRAGELEAILQSVHAGSAEAVEA
ncbi:MAG: glycosyltransferase [Acidobacteriota bacterium]|nr:glycosyltransferase [Acidobacteriota bacterium]